MVTAVSNLWVGSHKCVQCIELFCCALAGQCGMCWRWSISDQYSTLRGPGGRTKDYYPTFYDSSERIISYEIVLIAISLISFYVQSVPKMYSCAIRFVSQNKLVRATSELGKLTILRDRTLFRETKTYKGILVAGNRCLSCGWGSL